MNDIINEVLNELYFSLTVAEPFTDPFALEDEIEEHFYELAINPILKTDFDKGRELEAAYLSISTAMQKKAFSVGFKTAYRFLCTILFDDIPPLKAA